MLGICGRGMGDPGTRAGRWNGREGTHRGSSGNLLTGGRSVGVWEGCLGVWEGCVGVWEGCVCCVGVIDRYVGGVGR